MKLRIINKTRNSSLGEQIGLAHSFLQRWVGLLPHSFLPLGQGLFFPSCRSVHTFGMRLDLDILVLDCKLRVLKVYAPLKPNHLILPKKRGDAILEVARGTIAESGTREGDQLAVC
jgi:uncharacterized membrane protein (UPF0127 family)